MARLQGKTTIITGAASGLGRVAAQMFAAEGSRVVVADVVDGNETVDEINRLGGQAAFVQCDVTNEESWKHTIDFAIKNFGSVDVLYNNAGVMIGDDDDPVSTLSLIHI